MAAAPPGALIHSTLLALLLTASSASAAGGEAQPSGETTPTSVDLRDADLGALLREAIRADDPALAELAIVHGADPWSNTDGPAPVWLALDGSEALLRAVFQPVPPGREASVLRVWLLLAVDDPRGHLFEAHLPLEIVQQRIWLPDWLTAWTPAEQDALGERLGFEGLAQATHWTRPELELLEELFGAERLPAMLDVLWPDAVSTLLQHTGPAPSEAHRAVIDSAWGTLGWSAFVDTEAMRRDVNTEPALGHLMCDVNGSFGENDVRAAYGRPRSGAVRRRAAHITWPGVVVRFSRVDGDWRVASLVMNDHPPGCWSEAAHLIGEPPVVARWVLGPEPWVTPDGATITLSADHDGLVNSVTMTWREANDSLAPRKRARRRASEE